MAHSVARSAGAREYDVVLPEALHVWRTWSLAEDRRTRTPILRPIGSDRRPWAPREAMRARSCRHRSHRAPVEDCTCGLYAVEEPDLLRAARDPAVIGTVDLWGRVLEHERGYRAEFAYPQRLALICAQCFWRRGAGKGTVDRVARIGRRQLTPTCEEHLATAIDVGYPVRGFLDPTEVLGSLLGSYLVDPIDRRLAGP